MTDTSNDDERPADDSQAHANPAASNDSAKAEPAQTDHPTGSQAGQNAEDESPA